jgi:hypothetical protein
MEKPKIEKIKTTLRFDHDLWKAVKIKAIEENRNLQDVLDAVLRDYLHRTGSKKGGAR